MLPGNRRGGGSGSRWSVIAGSRLAAASQCTSPFTTTTSLHPLKGRDLQRGVRRKDTANWGGGANLAGHKGLVVFFEGRAVPRRKHCTEAAYPRAEHAFIWRAEVH